MDILLQSPVSHHRPNGAPSRCRPPRHRRLRPCRRNGHCTAPYPPPSPGRGAGALARPRARRGARAVPHATAAAGEPLLPGARGGVRVRGAGSPPHQPRRQDLRRQRPLARGAPADGPRRARAAAPRRVRGRLLDMAVHHPARVPGGRDHRGRQRHQPQVPASAPAHTVTCNFGLLIHVVVSLNHRFYGHIAL
jgi:hypothetical protein